MAAANRTRRVIVVDDPMKASILRRATPKGWRVVPLPLAANPQWPEDAPLGVNMRTMQPKWSMSDDVLGALPRLVDNGARVYVAADPSWEGDLFARRMQAAIGQRVKRVKLPVMNPEHLREAIKESTRPDDDAANAATAEAVLDRMVVRGVTPVLQGMLQTDRVYVTRQTAVMLTLLAEREYQQRFPDANTQDQFVLLCRTAGGVSITSKPMSKGAAERHKWMLKKGEWKVRAKKRVSFDPTKPAPRFTVMDYLILMGYENVQADMALDILRELYTRGCINHPTTPATELEWYGGYRGRGPVRTATNLIERRASPDSEKQTVTLETRYEWVRKAGSRVLLDYTAVKVTRAGWDIDEIEERPAIQRGEQRIVHAEVVPYEGGETHYTLGTLLEALRDLTEHGISSYANSIGMMLHEQYVRQVGDTLHLTQRGELLFWTLKRAFPLLVSPRTTRRIEKRLVSIRHGKASMRKMLSSFWRKVVQPGIDNFEESPGGVYTPDELPKCSHSSHLPVPTVLHFNTPGNIPHLECPECKDIMAIDFTQKGAVQPFTAAPVAGECRKCGMETLATGIGREGRYTYCLTCWTPA